MLGPIFRRISRNQSRIFHRRRLSNQSGQSTEDKANEAGKSFWETAKQYKFLAIPTAVFLVVSIDIINVQDHRYWLEEVAPWYVDFVREHYGFKEEDSDERRWRKVMRNFYTIPMEIVVRVGQKEIVLSDQDPQATAFDILEKLKRDGAIENGSDSSSSSRSVYCSPLIQFPDRSEGLDLPYDREDRLAFENKRIERKREYILSPSFLINSSWYSRVLDHSSEKTRSNPLSRFLMNFDNYLGNFLGGLDSYCECNNDISIIPYKLNEDSSSDRSRKAQSRRSTQKQVNSKDVLKQVALEKIKALEYRITVVENERNIGKRDIDSANQEISDLRKEITSFRQKYVNSFYFF